MNTTQAALPAMKFGPAVQHFFGRRPGDGLREFGEELKALTAEDRQELKEGLEKMGYTIVE